MKMLCFKNVVGGISSRDELQLPKLVCFLKNKKNPLRASIKKAIRCRGKGWLLYLGETRL